MTGCINTESRQMDITEYEYELQALEYRLSWDVYTPYACEVGICYLGGYWKSILRCKEPDKL